MFIRKKNYQEKLDLINDYRDLCMRKYNEIYSLEVEVENLKGLVKVMDERNKELEAKLGKEAKDERKV